LLLPGIELLPSSPQPVAMPTELLQLTNAQPLDVVKLFKFKELYLPGYKIVKSGGS
jgi:hypothetical protein